MTRLEQEAEEESDVSQPTAVHASRGKSLARIALEVALISVGVFLGLMGEQWREHEGHRELAQASLRRFRSEFEVNRKAVAAVKDRHVSDLKAMQDYFRTDPKTQQTLPLPFKGTNPAFLEYTAWDLALATQSLAYVEPELAASIAHVYAIQRQLDGATRDITQVMYAKSGDPNVRAFLSSMAVYFGDCTLIEPRLLSAYDAILPRLDRALGESVPTKSDTR